MNSTASSLSVPVAQYSSRSNSPTGAPLSAFEGASDKVKALYGEVCVPKKRSAAYSINRPIGADPPRETDVHPNHLLTFEDVDLQRVCSLLQRTHLGE